MASFLTFNTSKLNLSIFWVIHYLCNLPCSAHNCSPPSPIHQLNIFIQTCQSWTTPLIIFAYFNFHFLTLVFIECLSSWISSHFQNTQVSFMVKHIDHFFLHSCNSSKWISSFTADFNMSTFLPSVLLPISLMTPLLLRCDHVHHFPPFTNLLYWCSGKDKKLTVVY